MAARWVQSPLPHSRSRPTPPPTLLRPHSSAALRSHRWQGGGKGKKKANPNRAAEQKIKQKKGKGGGGKGDGKGKGGGKGGKGKGGRGETEDAALLQVGMTASNQHMCVHLVASSPPPPAIGLIGLRAGSSAQGRAGSCCAAERHSGHQEASRAGGSSQCSGGG